MGNTKEGKRYMNPEAFAAFLGASMNYNKKYGLKIQVNQFSTSTGGHSGHGGNGHYIDYRYSNTKGDVNEPVWTQWDSFDKAKSQFMVDQLIKFGYNSTPSNLRGDRYSILTQKGTTSDPALVNTSYYTGHHHHVHIQNYDVSHVKVVPKLSIHKSSSLAYTYSAPNWARSSLIAAHIYFIFTGKDPSLPDQLQR